MTIRELNAYRKAGDNLRRSPKMKRIRSEYEAIRDELSGEERTGEYAALLELRYIRRLSIVRVCMEMHISERSYFRFLSKIRDLIERE